MQGRLTLKGWKFHDQRLLEAHTLARRERVSNAHARGLTTNAIAFELNEPVATVQHDLKVLDLVPHATPLAECGRKAMKTVEKRYGVTLQRLAHQNRKLQSMREGWPPCHPGHARYLQYLYERGVPTSSAEIAAHFGRHPHYMSKAVGKLLRLRAITGTRRGNVWYYVLTDAVRLKRQEVLALRSEGEL